MKKAYFSLILGLFMIFSAITCFAQENENIQDGKHGISVDSNSHTFLREIDMARLKMIEARASTKNKPEREVLTSKIADISFNIGRLLFTDKRYSYAETQLNYCLQENPKHYGAMLYLAISIVENKNDLSRRRFMQAYGLIKECKDSGKFEDPLLYRLSDTYEDIIVQIFFDILEKGVDAYKYRDRVTDNDSEPSYNIEIE